MIDRRPARDRPEASSQAARFFTVRYQPGPAPSWIGGVVALTAAVAMILRGVDYLTPPPVVRVAGGGPPVRPARVLSVVESFASLQAWGVWITVAGAVVLVAVVVNVAGFRVLAHLFAVGVYGVYGNALIFGWIRADFDGGRFVVPVLVSLFLHGLCCYLISREFRTALLPPPDSETVAPTERS